MAFNKTRFRFQALLLIVAFLPGVVLAADPPYEPSTGYGPDCISNDISVTITWHYSGADNDWYGSTGIEAKVLDGYSLTWDLSRPAGATAWTDGNDVNGSIVVGIENPDRGIRAGHLQISYDPGTDVWDIGDCLFYAYAPPSTYVQWTGSAWLDMPYSFNAVGNRLGVEGIPSPPHVYSWHASEGLWSCDVTVYFTRDPKCPAGGPGGGAGDNPEPGDPGGGGGPPAPPDDDPGDDAPPDEPPATPPTGDPCIDQFLQALRDSLESKGFGQFLQDLRPKDATPGAMNINLPMPDGVGDVSFRLMTSGSDGTPMGDAVDGVRKWIRQILMLVIAVGAVFKFLKVLLPSSA